MAGYEDTRQMIINTLTNRLAGTEIQPEDHQEFALAITDYVRSVELLSGNAFIGFAEANTTPVQSDKGQCFYISTVGPGQTVDFVNFIDYNGNAISVSSPGGKMSLVTLIWNTQYWSSQVTTIDTNWSIAQQSGDSESMVMSQKAVTDAIAEAINALITTDRIADGAVTTEKIDTSAFDSTLSVSGKIAPANIVGEKLADLARKVGTISSVKEATSGIAYTNTINIDLKQGDMVDVYWDGDNIASNLTLLDSSKATLATLKNGFKQTVTIQNPTTYLSLVKKGSLVTDGVATFHIEGGLVKDVNNINEKVTSQQIEIDNIKKENIITLDKWVSGYFANKKTGANSKANGLFDVTDFVVIPLGVTSVSVRTAIQGNAGICFYDKEQTFISAVSGNDVALTDRIVEVPSNAVYLKISLLLSAGSRDDVKLSVIGFATILQNISQETRKASNAVLAGDGVEINPNRNVGWIDANGNKQSTPTTYFYTDVIELSKGQGISVTSADPSGTVVARISTWDSTGNTFYKVCAFGTTTETTARYVAIEDKEYIIVSGYSPNSMTIMFLENAIPGILTNNESYIKSIVKDSINEFEEFDFLPFQTIGIIGDSLASGCSNYYDDSAGKMVGLDRPAFSWGAFLGRETGIDVKLFAKGGASTKTWLSSDWGLAKAQQSGNKCECYIIGLGVNDYSKFGLDYVGTAADVHVGNESANADSFYGNYSRIIAALKAIQPRCKIFMFNLPNTPNNKINATTTAYRNAIKEIYTLYDNVYLLDLFEDKWYESKEINATYYGAHYTAIGYKAMAMHIKKMLNKFIKDNIDEFTDVQWITEPY